MGMVGCGKTMLATELLFRAYQRERTIVWVRAIQLVNEILDAPARSRGETRRYYQSAGHNRILLILRYCYPNRSFHFLSLGN